MSGDQPLKIREPSVRDVEESGWSELFLVDDETGKIALPEISGVSDDVKSAVEEVLGSIFTLAVIGHGRGHVDMHHPRLGTLMDFADNCGSKSFKMGVKLALSRACATGMAFITIHVDAHCDTLPNSAAWFTT